MNCIEKIAWESDILRSDYDPNRLILEKYNLRIFDYVALKNKKNILLRR